MVQDRAGVEHRGARLVPKGRVAAIVLLLAAWVVVTATGAGEAADADTWLNTPSFGWVVYVLLALMVLTVLLIAVSVMMFSSEAKQRPQAKRRPLWPLLILLLVFFALSQREPTEREPEAAPVPVATAEAEDQNEPAVPVVPRPGLGEATALIVIALAAAGLLLWARGDRVEPEPEDDVALDVALTPAIHKATEHLVLGDDPRSAVLLAYDGLEAALSDRDLPRGHSETPTEHLRRVLDSPRSGIGQLEPEPLLRLAELYEIARFSDRAITTIEQNEAGQALQRVRDRITTT